MASRGKYYMLPRGVGAHPVTLGASMRGYDALNNTIHRGILEAHAALWNMDVDAYCRAIATANCRDINQRSSADSLDADIARLPDADTQHVARFLHDTIADGTPHIRRAQYVRDAFLPYRETWMAWLQRLVRAMRIFSIYEHLLEGNNDQIAAARCRGETLQFVWDTLLTDNTHEWLDDDAQLLNIARRVVGETHMLFQGVISQGLAFARNLDRVAFPRWSVEIPRWATLTGSYEETLVKYRKALARLRSTTSTTTTADPNDTNDPNDSNDSNDMNDDDRLQMLRALLKAVSHTTT